MLPELSETLLSVLYVCDSTYEYDASVTEWFLYLCSFLFYNWQYILIVPGEYSGWGVASIAHHHLVPRLKEE
jgi:hypothetical protein